MYSFTASYLIQKWCRITVWRHRSIPGPPWQLVGSMAVSDRSPAWMCLW